MANGNKETEFMKAKRIKRIEEVVTNCITQINTKKLSREELIVTLGQLLIRSGYSVHWGLETPRTERPESVDQKIAEDLYSSNPTTGTTLMKVGFDLQDVLLLKQ